MSIDPNAVIDPLPGCRGDCQQGRRPCLNAEDCLPDGPPLTRNGFFIGCAVVILLWAIVIFGALTVWRML